MKHKQFMLRSMTWIILIILWWCITTINPSSLFPSPEKVLYAGINLIQNGYNSMSLFYHFYMSMQRLVLALGAAIVCAVPLGLLSGYVPLFRTIFDSLVQFYRPLPPMSYYVLLIIALGIDETSKVMLLFLAAFAPIYISCASAVSHVNPQYEQSAQTLGASKTRIFWSVILPASAPDMFVGLRTAVGVCYTTLVSAEMIAATSGMGWMILDAYNYLKTDVVVVCIIIMGLTGIFLDKVVQSIGSRVNFWMGK